MPVCSWSVMKRSSCLGLGVDRADPGDRGEGARRLQEADPVPGRRRVDDHQVVLAPLLHLAVELGQLPDLADRHQLLQPGRGGGEVVEDSAAEQQVAHRPHLELEQHVLAHRLVGVDRDRPEVLLHLDLVEADLGVVEHPRGVLLRGDLADDRALAFGGGAQPERHRDGRLADATLAGDEDQPLVEEFGDRAIPSNFARPAGKAARPCEYPRNGISKPQDQDRARPRSTRSIRSSKSSSGWRKPCPSARSPRSGAPTPAGRAEDDSPRELRGRARSRGHPRHEAVEASKPAAEARGSPTRRRAERAADLSVGEEVEAEDAGADEAAAT